MKMLPLIIVVKSDSANNEQTLEGFVTQILSQYIAQSHGSDVMIIFFFTKQVFLQSEFQKSNTDST